MAALYSGYISRPVVWKGARGFLLRNPHTESDRTKWHPLEAKGSCRVWPERIGRHRDIRRQARADLGEQASDAAPVLGGARHWKSCWWHGTAARSAPR